MAVFLEELEEEEAGTQTMMLISFRRDADMITTLVSAARGEDSEWSIWIFGGNPMLEDETVPFSMDDEVFDEILETMINLEG
jgi:hypothetical protein